MELVNVREIFKNTIRYENQQVTIGGWVEVTVIPKILDSL